MKAEEKRAIQRRKRTQKLTDFAGLVLLVIFLLVYISPILFMVSGSLKPDDRVLAQSGSLKAFLPSEAGFQNYIDVFRRVDFVRFMFNSNCNRKYCGIWTDRQFHGSLRFCEIAMERPKSALCPGVDVDDSTV